MFSEINEELMIKSGDFEGMTDPKQGEPMMTFVPRKMALKRLNLILSIFSYS